MQAEIAKRGAEIASLRSEVESNELRTEGLRAELAAADGILERKREKKRKWKVRGLGGCLAGAYGTEQWVPTRGPAVPALLLTLAAAAQECSLPLLSIRQCRRTGCRSTTAPLTPQPASLSLYPAFSDVRSLIVPSPVLPPRSRRTRCWTIVSPLHHR